MDTETVFKIIAMLDARIESYRKLLDSEEEFDLAYVCGQGYALEMFKDHLQEYIELQVAQVEGT
jgi:hypothetical protein